MYKHKFTVFLTELGMQKPEEILNLSEENIAKLAQLLLGASNKHYIEKVSRLTDLYNDIIECPNCKLCIREKEDLCRALGKQFKILSGEILIKGEDD